MQASELIARFEKFAPLKLKWEHDPTGLQIGDPHQDIHKVLVTLMRPEVVQEAITIGADMILLIIPSCFDRPTILIIRILRKQCMQNLQLTTSWCTRPIRIWTVLRAE